jgi:HD-GYP domain-containing protein (c-di-GMP phosphodiesterase class II)
MTSNRPYRPALSTAEAISELRRCAGTQFDPRIVDAIERQAKPRTTARSSARARARFSPLQGNERSVITTF